jgi:hypothetical protein
VKGRLTADKLRRAGELVHAAKENPEARREAHANGIAVGKRVRYYENDGGRPGVEHYGVVNAVNPLSVVIELSAAGMLKGGEDIIVREEEVPFANVREILGDGRLAQRKPTEEKRALPVAPARDKPYSTCDFCGSAIFEVLDVKGRGLVALCRNHAKGPTDDEPTTFKFKLGLSSGPAGKGSTWKVWPKPTEQELSAWASRPKLSPSRGSSGKRSSGKSPPSGSRSRKRKARSR